MSRSVSIDEMAAAINEGLEEYADLSAQGVKSAVRKSAKAVKEQINSSAPVRTGRYAKSWAGTDSIQSFPVYAFASAGKGACQTRWRKGSCHSAYRAR